MKKNIYFSAPTILGLVLLLQTCIKITDPITTQSGPDTTSHNFTWTADTLRPDDAYQIYLYDIWGTDENNVWAVGHSGLIRYRIWHYDGVSWKNVFVPSIDHVPTYFEIIGFDENDFWIVGYGITTHSKRAWAYLLHYDGSWNRMDNRDLPICQSVWGTSSDNMFFGCDSGLIVKYDGEKFTKYETGKLIQFRGLWGFNDSTVYAIGTETEPSGKYFAGFYQLKNDKIMLLDSSRTFDKGFGMDIWGYDIDNFYSTIDGVYKYDGFNWINEFYSTTIYSIYGNKLNNIFAGGHQSTFYHYNGDNWKKLSFGDDLIDTIRGIWCKDDYVFVIQHIGYYSRILKGKRKD